MLWRKKKLLRFTQIHDLPNVYHHVQNSAEVPDFHLKGKWHEEVFKNNKPIVLELGCGKGEYSVGMAKHLPDKNFIGADIKGNRIWLGANTGIEEKLNNLAFLRTRIESIDTCFAKDEVDEIWITFPDPQPQKPRERKRLTHPMFLNRYKKFLKPEAFIHLKTDSKLLYEFTLETIANEKHELAEDTNNLYADQNVTAFANFEFLTGIQTYYETLFTKKGFDICYVRFGLR